MKNSVITLSVFALALLGNIANSQAWTECYSCNDCTDKLLTNDYVVLVSDTIHYDSGPCVEIYRDDVKFQCSPGTISITADSYSAGPAIYVEDAYSVILHTCELFGFETAIQVENSDDIDIRGMLIEDGNNGIRLSGSGTINAFVGYNELNDLEGRGIILTSGANNNTIRGNDINFCDISGIYLSSTTSDNYLYYNDVRYAGSYDIDNRDSTNYGWRNTCNTYYDWDEFPLKKGAQGCTWTY